MCRPASFLSALLMMGSVWWGASMSFAFEEPALPTYDEELPEWVDDVYVDPPAEDRLNPNTGKTLAIKPSASIKGNQKKATVHTRPQMVKKEVSPMHDDEGVIGQGDLEGDEPIQRVVIFQSSEKGLAGDVLFSNVKETGQMVDLGSGISAGVQQFLESKIGKPLSVVESEELALLISGMIGREVQCHSYALDRGDLVIEIGKPLAKFL